ncbi:MAG: SpoIIE family protein phosphatase [Spirochaetes bacterium]|nr:SpoIIE family protein phosphatase [Spirochaetota bacterium]
MLDIIHPTSLGLAAALFVGLGAYSFRHRFIAGAASFSTMSFLGAWGAIAEIISMICATQACAHFWYNARFIALAGIPVAWLVFAIQYSMRGKLITPHRIAALCAIPCITQVMAWTNGFHGLWLVKDVTFQQAGKFLIATTASRVFGPWFIIHSFYGYLCFLVGIVLVIHMSFRMKRLFRGQAMAIWIGIFLIMAGSLIPTFKLLPAMKFNLMHQFFALGAMVFAWSIFRYRFLDLAPVARDRLVDWMDDAMFVVDRGNRIVDLNPAMRRLITAGFSSAGRSVPERMVGMSAGEVLYPWRDVVQRFKDTSEIKTEISTMIGAEKRHFDLHIFPLADTRGDAVERMAVLRDITPRRKIELALREKTHELNERLKELNCLYGVTEIMRIPGIPLDDIIRRTIEIMPAAWQYPDITSVHLVLDEREFSTMPCEDNRWTQSADIVVENSVRGSLSVCYREERPPADEGPFLAQERALLDAIAERMGKAIERRSSEESMRLSKTRLEALHEMEHRAFESERALIEYALEEEVRLTGSEIGYFHFVKGDQKSLELYAWSKRTMETCTVSPDRHYPLDRAGVWADCARLRRPVIHNDYQALPDKKGYPEGHSPIRRHLSVPIINDGKVIAISGVANKSAPYNESDVLHMELFMHGVWRILERRRVTEEKDDLLAILEEKELYLRNRNERMELDLMIAQSAQKSFVSRDKPACDFLRVDFRYVPLERVGGDYFSFFKSGEDRLAFFICDVSGHGVAAALFTAMIRSMSDRLFTEMGDNPTGFLETLNRELLDYISSNFVTAIYGIFERPEGADRLRLRFACGGHVRPVIMRHAGEFSFSESAGMIMGVKEGVRYQLIEENLEPGDRLYVYTDGIPETINAVKEMIGFDSGLLDLFRESTRESLGESLDEVLEGMARFRNGVPPGDDITLIGFEAV